MAAGRRAGASAALRPAGRVRHHLGMKIPVRAARPEDVPALVRLRLANAERHIELDPVAYRLPDAGAVRRYFEGVLSPPAPGDVLVLVAEASVRSWGWPRWS